MINKFSVITLFVGSWSFGIVSNVQNYFVNSSSFLLTHEIKVKEILLSAIIIYFLIPIIFFIIYIGLENKKPIQKIYVYLIVTILVSQGIVKNLDNFYNFDLLTFYITYIILLGLLLLVVRNRIYSSNLVILVGAFLPFQLFFLFFQTDIPKYININSKVQIESQSTNGTNVNIIILDEFALSEILIDPITINKERFPGFYELSKITTFYPNTTTNSGVTQYSAASILTGQFPEEIVKLKNPNINYYYPENLINLLSSSYSISADEFATSFCSNIKCENLNVFKGNNRYRSFLIQDLFVVGQLAILPASYVYEKYPKLQNSWGNFLNHDEDGDLEKIYAETDRLQSLKKYIDNKSSNQKSKFNLIHTIFPHSPYEFLPDGKRVTPSRAILNVPQANNMTIHNLNLQQAYLFQLKYLDTLILSLAEKIKTQMRDEIVIVTSDHGISFQPNNSVRAEQDQGLIDAETISSVLYVPLFIHWPSDNNGKVNLKKVQLVDLYPSILKEINYPMGKLKKRPDGFDLSTSTSHSEFNWNESNQVLNQAEIENGFKRVIEENIKEFGTQLGECDIYGVGPFKEYICKSTDNFNIKKSSLRAFIENKNELFDVNPASQAYIVDFMIYSDELSGYFRENPKIEKWFGASYKDKIVSITKGIIHPSTRDNGNAIDLQFSATLFGINELIELNEIRIFEFDEGNEMKEIKIDDLN
jgi:hypothetical protein